MSEPSRITHEDIAEALNVKGIVIEIGTAWTEEEVSNALAAMKGLLPEDHDWYRCKPCPFCGMTAVISLPTVGVEKFQAGMHPQYAFPGESAEKREMALTGIHPECWNNMLPPPEED